MKQINQKENKVENRYKWLVMFSFCLNSISNILLFTGLSPIWSMVAIYYGTTDYDLNWFTNMYYVTLMSIAFIFNPFINKYFGISQILSCIFTTLGLWLILIVEQNFMLGLLCFAFIGIGEAFYFQVPLHLSKIWFSHDERIVSTFIAQYSSNVGMLLGYLSSSIYFYNITDETEFAQRYRNFVQFNAILATISLVLNISSLKKPKQEIENLQIRDSIWKSLYKIVTAEESFFDLLSVSSFIGLSWCYTLLFGTQQYLIGQTYIEVTQTSIAFQLGQIVAAAFCTYKLQNYSKKGMPINFDLYIKGTISIGFWSLVFEILFFDDMHIILLLIINFFIGAGLGGLYSVLLESLMEKHFPVQELAIGSILQGVACTVSIVITMTLIIPKFLEYGFQISCYLMIIPFCYISVFYKTTFKRFEFEA